MRRIKAILLLCLVPAALWAAPAVTGVSGTVSNGGTITISGSGFGSGPSILIFDDFEGGTNNATIKTGAGSATVGAWSALGENGTQIYSNTNKNSGNLAYQVAVGTTCTASGYIFATSMFPAATNEFFGTWWVYLPADEQWPGYASYTQAGCTEASGPECAVNWKQVWVHSGAYGNTDADVIAPTLLGNGSGALTGNGAGIYTSTAVGYGHGMAKGQWKRTMLYWVGSPTGSGSVVWSAYLLRNGTNTPSLRLAITSSIESTARLQQS